MTETDHTTLDLIHTRRPDPAPVYSPAVRMEDYSIDQRFRWAKAEVNKLGETLTMADIEKLFRMPKRGAQRLVKKYLAPIGGVKLIGRTQYIDAWAVRTLVGVDRG